MKYYEEKLCEEKGKVNILEQDNQILNEKLNEDKASYCMNLKKFRDEIQKQKISQQYGTQSPFEVGKNSQDKNEKLRYFYKQQF